MKSYDIAVLPGKSGPERIALPFYSAEEHTALENRQGPFTVVEILKEVFNEDFRAAAENYIATFPEDIKKALNQNDLEDIRLVRIGEPRVECSIDDYSYLTDVDLYFSTLIEGLVPPEGRWKPYNIELKMRYLLDLAGRRCSVPLVTVSDGTGSRKPSFGGIPANSYLLPVMRSGDYDDIAHRIHQLYYPEALEDAVAVDGYELAHRMGLVTRKVRFRPGTDKRGLIYFTKETVPILGWDGEPKEINVKPLTLLINADLCPTPEIENSTVIHECSHAYLDSRFFLLQALAGGDRAACTGRTVNGIRFLRPNSPVEWMELQAEKLPAYILMEENNTRGEIEDLYDCSRWDRSPANVMSIVEQLAEKFGVSKSMAKYRMIELGFPEAEGVYCFEDNKRIPDHGCAGSWSEGTTYCISWSEAACLISESPDFLNALRSCCYTYLEGHYCLNDMKYVQEDRFGFRRMTEYARRHIDECCIAFTVSGRYVSAEYYDGHAARNKKKKVTDKYQSRHDFSAEPDSKERVKQNMQFSEDAIIWEELKSDMPTSFQEAVQKILDLKGISQNDAAFDLGVSRAAFRKWCSEKKPSIRHAVAICIALDVRADIGETLVRLTGSQFRTTKEDSLLHCMLFDTQGLLVSRANEIMIQNKFAPLTCGEDDSIAC